MIFTNFLELSSHEVKMYLLESGIEILGKGKKKPAIITNFTQLGCFLQKVPRHNR